MTKPWVDFKALKAAVDFRIVLERYGLEVVQKGPELVARCPFHSPDARPSFRVNSEKGAFHCFGCGAKGNVLDFVSRKEGITIRAAADALARWFSVTPKEPVSGDTDIVPPPPQVGS